MFLYLMIWWRSLLGIFKPLLKIFMFSQIWYNYLTCVTRRIFKSIYWNVVPELLHCFFHTCLKRDVGFTAVRKHYEYETGMNVNSSSVGSPYGRLRVVAFGAIDRCAKTWHVMNGSHASRVHSWIKVACKSCRSGK